MKNEAKKKTSLQECIEHFESIKNQSSAFRDVLFLDGVIGVLQSKLQKEKDDLIEAFDKGENNFADLAMFFDIKYNDGDNYYTKTFEQ